VTMVEPERIPPSELLAYVDVLLPMWCGGCGRKEWTIQWFPRSPDDPGYLELECRNCGRHGKWRPGRWGGPTTGDIFPA
jgi:hypothetical protein